MGKGEILYSVRVKDLETVLQDEHGIIFDDLTEEQQDEFIKYATNGLNLLDWYTAIDCEVRTAIKKAKKRY